MNKEDIIVKKRRAWLLDTWWRKAIYIYGWFGVIWLIFWIAMILVLGYLGL